MRSSSWKLSQREATSPWRAPSPRRWTAPRIAAPAGLGQNAPAPPLPATVLHASRTATVVSTDIVDSTAVHVRLGDEAMAALWARHDAAARALIRQHGGLELGRSDGFLALFDDAAQARRFAAGYHAALAALQPPLRARVGAHRGPMRLRENAAADRALGALAFEADGLALPAATRAMQVAEGGQTVLTQAAAEGAGAAARALGWWRLKGLDEPLALFADAGAPEAAAAPRESARAYRVQRSGEGWAPCRALPHNLPAERDPFVGRLDALRALQAAFDGGARLVSLLGPGGVGKTRLALQHARGWLGDFPGGAWFCDLSAATGPEGIVHAVAQALGLPLAGGEPAALIGRALEGRGECLLLLDNFEQVALHAEATVGRWLEAAPQARFAVTTREVLGLGGEQVLNLAPMHAAEAEQLFRLRASAAAGTAVGAPQPGDGVAELVALLDHLPLAIELAASRSRLMSPAAMRERIGQRFQLLAARGGRSGRQATMRATLDWSWELLQPAERAALAQLAVFEGGFEVEDAEAVVKLPRGTAGWVPDLLQALLEKSWLRTLDGRRLGLLRTVQDYAAERLAPARRREAEARHGRHFAALDEARATRGRGVELDNIVAACRRAVAAGRAEAEPLLGHAWAVLHRTGPFALGAALAEDVRRTTPAGTPAWARTQRVQGAAEALLGRREAARAHYREALAALGGPGCEALRSELLSQLALMAVGDGRLPEAEALLDAAQAALPAEAEAAAAAPVPLALATARYTAASVRARVHIARSDWAAAGRCFEAALAVALAAGQRRWEAGLRGNLGSVAQALGRLDDARAHWQAGLALAEEQGDRQWAGNTRCNLGLLLLHGGEHGAARRELALALETARALGHRRLEFTALCNLGIVAEAQQQHAEAVSLLGEAAACAQAQRMPAFEALAAAWLALAQAGAGAVAEAAAQRQRAMALGEAAPDGDTACQITLLDHLLRHRLGEAPPAGAAQALDAAAASAGAGGLEARYLLQRIEAAAAESGEGRERGVLRGR